MRGVDELLTTVRDRASRERLADAIRAYQAGAHNAALIAVWVTVALDLVGKIRELADTGDAGAVAFAENLDKAIKAENTTELMKLERGLLDTCRDDFEIVSAREHIELTRLVQDRHVAAHPAFVAPDQAFEATPELVRNHLSVAVHAVLAHPPIPGKGLLERFFNEIEGGSFPRGPEALTAYLRERYLGRTRSSFRRNFGIVLVKAVLDPPKGNVEIADRCGECLHAIAIVDPVLLSTSIDAVVRRKEEGPGLSELELMRLMGYLGDFIDTWVALPPASVARVTTLLGAALNEALVEARVFAVEPANPEVAAAWHSRLALLPASNLRDAVAQRPHAGLVRAALGTFVGSGGWRPAETNMTGLILPLASCLDLETLREVLAAFRENRQIREASGMPYLTVELLDGTSHIPGGIDAWKELAIWLRDHAPDDNKAGHYAYPDLRARLGVV